MGAGNSVSPPDQAEVGQTRAREHFSAGLYPARLGLFVGVRWKPIVWDEADHYPQWLAYPTREGKPPRQGSQLMLAEHPGRTYVATIVESGADPVLAWLKPLPRDS